MRFLQWLVILAVLLTLPEAVPAPPDYSGASTAYLGSAVFVLPLDGDALYLPTDELGRARGAAKLIRPEDLEFRPRGDLSGVNVTGFVQRNYPFIPGMNLYNRCHMIAHSLGGEDIAENLFTGTHTLNTSAMRLIEERVGNYILRTGDAVRYEVILRFGESNLVCYGAYISARSMSSDEIDFTVYCYNIEPGVSIDFSNGNSEIAQFSTSIEEFPEDGEVITFVLNTNTKRIHSPDCPSVTEMKPKNRRDYYGDLESLLAAGYALCGRCNGGIN